MTDTLTEEQRTKVAHGCVNCEGTGLSVSRFDRDMKPIEYEPCDFCAVAVVTEIVGAAKASVLREAAEWLEDKPLPPVLTQRAKTIEWACNYIAERLRVRADDYDQSGVKP